MSLHNIFSLVNNYQGLGSKMVRLGAEFNCRRLLQIRNNRVYLFLNRIFRNFAAVVAALETAHKKFFVRF